MAGVLIHQFRGGEQAYIENTDTDMVRRIAELLARNIAEVDAPEAVEEIIECLDEPVTIDDAQAALTIYCDEVSDEGFSFSVADGVLVIVQTPAPPIAESVARMRHHLEALLHDSAE